MKDLIILLSIISLSSCNVKDPASSEKNDRIELVPEPDKDLREKYEAQINTPEDFLPKGFVLKEKLEGDLNRDGVKDLVMLIKATDKSKFVKDEYRGELDRNRRGIIVLFRKGKSYELASKNYDCFSSENEDGGVYYAPELWFEIKKSKLYIRYSHGRYGYWDYTFRFQNTDFELIGYDEHNHHGPILLNQTSINFITGKKIYQENVNASTDDYENEVFKETKSDIKVKSLVKLSEVKDFDELDVEK